MAIKNKDVVKRVGTRGLAKILGCSVSTVNTWVKKGLGVKQYDFSTFNDIARHKVNSFSVEVVRKWLEDNNKAKYLTNLNDYLNKDYKCELCRENTAELLSDSQGYVCKECDNKYKNIV